MNYCVHTVYMKGVEYKVKGVEIFVFSFVLFAVPHLSRKGINKRVDKVVHTFTNVYEAYKGSIRNATIKLKYSYSDAYSAQQLVRTLLRLTKQGTTIMCTIHQPSSKLFAMFHKVLFLTDGRISYIGSPDEAVSFFAQ